jgi:hypothetical protein
MASDEPSQDLIPHCAEMVVPIAVSRFKSVVTEPRWCRRWQLTILIGLHTLRGTAYCLFA